MDIITDRLMLPLHTEFDVDAGVWVLKNDAEEVLAWVEDEQTARDLAHLGDIERNAFAELASVYDRLARRLRRTGGEPAPVLNLKVALQGALRPIEEYAKELHERAHRKQAEADEIVRQAQARVNRYETALVTERIRRERLQERALELEAKLEQGRVA
ncbi:hypothetical protein [Halorhodospira sp. 9622]|uniref:hypothetical protein n=1 Tax=Halorhodospira sp. 9622 TaxID=2899136 RepID=UPI001EE84428|nr:hypothetical protein [Halorhodospira sp. 9622]MCG5538989.1 hypothetical protein [Halorhodospira sp. 9622]